MIDVNENRAKPQFEELAYQGSISEAAAVGSVVMRVKATDSDIAIPDHKLTYSIRSGSGLGSFTIDSEGRGDNSLVLC